MPPLFLGADRRQLLKTASDIAAWWWTVVRMSARQGWDALPGPWPVKAGLIALLAVAQIVPGQVDDIALVLVIGYVKRRTAARKARECDAGHTRM
jgi:hypothetical protein